MPTFSLVSEPAPRSLHHFPKSVGGPPSPAAAAPAVGVGRIQRLSATIEHYCSSEYESLGKGKGRSFCLRGLRRNGRRSFGDLRPRGRSKEPRVALPGLPLPIVRVRRVVVGERRLREHGEALRRLHRRYVGQERRVYSATADSKTSPDGNPTAIRSPARRRCPLFST